MLELLLARIISGTLQFKCRKKIYWIKSPTSIDKYCAQIAYYEAEKEAIEEGFYTDDEAVELLIKNGLWSQEKDSELQTTKKDIDILKQELFKNYFKTDQRNKTRQYLQVAKNRIATLFSEKNQYHHLSCSGYAATARTKYLVGFSLYNSSHKRVYPGNTFMTKRTNLIEEAMLYYANNEISEATYRSISRSDQWKTIWNSSKFCSSLFNCSSVDLTQEQLQLISWSNFYSNISESPDCPDDEIINDDDALDGWTLIQRKQISGMRKQKIADQILNTMPNAQEVFIPVENKEEYERVVNLNDFGANRIKQERLAALKKHGTINEEHMPDSQRQIRMMAGRM